ncbi:MAG: hypothetical protein ACR2LN_08005 [Candidatus Levyibacteriota bacterium]
MQIERKKYFINAHEIPSRTFGPVTIFDLRETDLLPHDYQERMKSLAQHAELVEMKGGADPSSLESPGTIVPYRVVDGETIRNLPDGVWLDDLYRGAFTQLASQLSGEKMAPSTDIKSGANLNVVGRGHRYELHKDTNPLTGLLYPDSVRKGEGGVLSVQVDNNVELRISPQEGMLLLSALDQTPHQVLVYTGRVPRLSGVMNFFPQGKEPQRRPTLTRHVLNTQ